MDKVLEKVTAFITRRRGSDVDLLVFEHPTTGLQIPAGTVEYGESHAEAVLREASEETGLDGLEVREYIGQLDTTLPERQLVVYRKTKVYARPDITSFDWAELRRGIHGTWIREHGDFTQFQYKEYDRCPDPSYVTYLIMGWIPSESLTRRLRRHFYHLMYAGDSDEGWVQFTDNHFFRPFWVPMSDKPAIVPTQQQWLDYVTKRLKYDFR